MKKQLGFAFEINRCTGCKACVVACLDQNDKKADQARLRTIAEFEQQPYPARIACLSIACMHCGDAPCLMACPTGALFRHSATGVVDVNQDICVGCRSCALACPFGAPKFMADGKMAKCDLCHVRIDHGLQPACVQTCTTGALQFGDLDSLNVAKTQDSATKIIKAAGVFEK
jgi:anaerobic dimethyl sulfoxide reductase subunit B (iron-sulfur subunit)